MFNVNIYEIDLPLITRDYKGTTSVAAGSDNITIKLNPQIPELSWTGMWLVLTSGNLKGYMAQIGSYSGEAGTDTFNLAQELPSTPDTGSTFKIISMFEVATSFSFTGKVYDYTKYVDGLSFNTEIGVGYSRCTIQLKKVSTELANTIAELLGNYLIVSDNYAKDVYHGIIAGITLDGDGGQIDCVGIGDTNSWYEFFGLYNEDATNTSTSIIRDILSFNPYIDQANQQIDNIESWDAAQQAVGGIGPLDFTQSNVTVKAALDKILAMGNYGLINEDTKKAYLQVWDYGVPYLIFANPDPSIDDANWVISNLNLGENKSNLSLVGDIAESFSYTSGSYNTEEGTTIETAGYVNIDLIDKYGFKKREVTSGQSRLLSFNIMRVAAEDNNKIAGPGKIAIEGNVRSWGAGTYNSPPYMIRAGDIILIEDAITGSSVFKNEIFHGSVAQVGTTSYSDGKMTIGLAELADVSEIFKKQIEVDQVA